MFERMLLILPSLGVTILCQPALFIGLQSSRQSAKVTGNLRCEPGVIWLVHQAQCLLDLLFGDEAQEW
jgi:hypothetical protein